MRLKLKYSLLVLAGAGVLAASAAPIHPALPNPPNLATNVPANADLLWSPGDSELVVNGNFETGNFTGWTRLNPGGGGGGGNLNNTYINNGTYVPVDGDGPHEPYAGNFSTVTDQNGPGSIILFQDIAIPTNAASVVLTWADMIRNQFNTFVPNGPGQQPQEYRVEIRNLNDVILATPYRTEPGDPTITSWQKRSYNLDAFKGQTIRIVFIEEQFWSFFNLHLDNISIRVRDPGPFTYHVYFGTTNVLTTNHFAGSTTTGAWSLPQLSPLTTYYWRLVAQQGSLQVTGVTWRFTTAAVGPVDGFQWDTISSPQTPGAALSVRLTAVDSAKNVVSNFIGTVNLTGAQVTGSTPGNLMNAATPSSFAAFDRGTVGYSFTPNRDLLVTGVRRYSGEKVSIWTDAGVLLGAARVEGTNASWQNAALGPIQLFAGRTYRVGLYSPRYETNYLRLDGSPDFAHGVLHESYEGSGDAFPTNIHSARWWFVDLNYSVRELQAVTVAPSITAAFANGTWSGLLSLNAEGSVLLRAEDNSGRVGLANAFSLVDDSDGDGMPNDWETDNDLNPDDPSDAFIDADGDGSANLAEYRAGTNPHDPASALRIVSLSRSGSEVRIRFNTRAGKVYELYGASALGAWQAIQQNIAGTGGTDEIVVSNASAAQSFFRVMLVE